jgi:hypothetical protein
VAIFSETYTVTVNTDSETGLVVEEWRKNGKLDRTDGPALILRDASPDTVIRGQWWRDGKPIEPLAPVRQASIAPAQEPPSPRL